MEKTPNFPKYQVSNLGNVKYIRFNRLFKFNENDEYYRIKIYDKTNTSKHMFVHRLVAETFIENPENKLTVNHKDADKHNNTIFNLEWLTHQGQVKHIMKNKLKDFSKGSNCRKVQMYKHDKKDNTIKTEYKQFNSAKEAYKELGIREGKFLNMLKAGDIYKNYSGEYLDICKDFLNEIWKTVIIDGDEYEDYFVSNFGRIRNKIML